MVKNYSVLYIDPPWLFKTRTPKNNRRVPYPTLTTPELCALDVPRLYARDCAVFMWTTGPNLPEAFTVANAWGLTYVTMAFVWAKTTRHNGDGWMFDRLDADSNWFMGLGYITRANAELCLLFKHGKPKRNKTGRGLRQLVVSPRREHSAKPLEMYEKIETLYPGPYCEIFSRHERPGWDAIGNHIDGQDIRQLLRKEHEHESL